MLGEASRILQGSSLQQARRKSHGAHNSTSQPKVSPQTSTTQSVDWSTNFKLQMRMAEPTNMQPRLARSMRPINPSKVPDVRNNRGPSGHGYSTLDASYVRSRGSATGSAANSQETPAKRATGDKVTPKKRGRPRKQDVSTPAAAPKPATISCASAVQVGVNPESDGLRTPPGASLLPPRERPPPYSPPRGGHNLQQRREAKFVVDYIENWVEDLDGRLRSELHVRGKDMDKLGWSDILNLFEISDKHGRNIHESQKEPEQDIFPLTVTYKAADDEDVLCTPPGTPRAPVGDKPPPYIDDEFAKTHRRALAKAASTSANEPANMRSDTSVRPSCSTLKSRPPPSQKPELHKQTPSTAVQAPSEACDQRQKHLLEHPQTESPSKRLRSTSQPVHFTRSRSPKTRSSVVTEQQMPNSRTAAAPHAELPPRQEPETRDAHPKPSLATQRAHCQQRREQISYPRLRFSPLPEAVSSTRAQALAGGRDGINRARADQMYQIVSSEMMQLSLWQLEGPADEQHLRTQANFHLQRFAAAGFRACSEALQNPLTVLPAKDELIADLEQQTVWGRREEELTMQIRKVEANTSERS